MIESLDLSATVQAIAVIGLVLLEAAVLYVGYGIAERRTAPLLFDTLKRD